MTPSLLVDITGLGRTDPSLAEIRATERGVRIGALVRMSAIAEDPNIASAMPLSARRSCRGAPRLRNMATIGGNLPQRTRCVYFRDVTVPECNKREPGSGCAARLGIHRNAAVFGASASCVALPIPPTWRSPSSPSTRSSISPARLASGRWPRGTFSSPPGDTPWQETVVAPDEVITAVELPPLPAKTQSYYLKVRDRETTSSPSRQRRWQFRWQTASCAGRGSRWAAWDHSLAR